VTGWDWNFGDGTAHSTAQNPSHTYANSGNFQVTLTVTDNDGAQSSPVQHQVNVGSVPNQAPTAAFTAPSCTATVACQFNDGSSDGDGSVTGWDWNFGDGSAHSTAQNPSHTYSTSGNFQVTLTVTDNDGAHSSPTQHQVSVGSAPNQAPSAAFTAPSCTATQPCQFNDESSDPDGNVTGWDWNFGDGTAHSTAQNPSHTYASSGPFTVTLTVTDNDNAQSSPVQHQVTVGSAPNQAPTAAFDPPTCTATVACQFTDGSTDSDGSVTGWDWDFGDSSPHSTAQNPSHTYATDGSFTATLTVTDNDGTSSSPVSHSVTVSPAPNGAATAQIGMVKADTSDGTRRLIVRTGHS
jgi:PKD repeat protein